MKRFKYKNNLPFKAISAKNFYIRLQVKGINASPRDIYSKYGARDKRQGPSAWVFISNA
jgi:hypothetical protein